jgi:hypothetical protein
MKSKKVKEVAKLQLERVDEDWTGKRTYTYVCDTYSNLILPDEIIFKIKRQPNTINEFLKVNELLEEDVLEELIKRQLNK